MTTRVNHSLGKFESEPLSTQYAYELSMDGCDDGVYSDGCGGESYTVLSGPFHLTEALAFVGNMDGTDCGMLESEAMEFINSVGCIVHESNSGFVSCTWFDSQAEFDAAIAELDEQFVPEDDCDDRSFGPSGVPSGWDSV